jgi:hypothetical protein
LLAIELSALTLLAFSVSLGHWHLVRLKCVETLIGTGLSESVLLVVWSQSRKLCLLLLLLDQHASMLDLEVVVVYIHVSKDGKFGLFDPFLLVQIWIVRCQIVLNILKTTTWHSFESHFRL